MDKLTKPSGQNRQPQPKPTDPPTEPADPSPELTYRIICNSEYFIVLNPVQRRPIKKCESEQHEKAAEGRGEKCDFGA